jgi:hypothetical protein
MELNKQRLRVNKEQQARREKFKHRRYLLTRASVVRKGGSEAATAAEDFFWRESQVGTEHLSSQRPEEAPYAFDDPISDGLKAESNWS